MVIYFHYFFLKSWSWPWKQKFICGLQEPHISFSVGRRRWPCLLLRFLGNSGTWQKTRCDILATSLFAPTATTLLHFSTKNLKNCMVTEIARLQDCRVVHNFVWKLWILFHVTLLCRFIEAHSQGLTGQIRSSHVLSGGLSFLFQQAQLHSAHVVSECSQWQGNNLSLGQVKT